MTHDGPPRDHAFPDDEMSGQKSLEENVKSKSTWLRLFFMIVIVVLYGVSRIVLGAVILIQFCYVLVTGSTHRPLLQLGRSLATYTYQIVVYLTFNSDVRPFPFDADWPVATTGSEPQTANDDDTA